MRRERGRGEWEVKRRERGERTGKKELIRKDR